MDDGGAEASRQVTVTLAHAKLHFVMLLDIAETQLRMRLEVADRRVSVGRARESTARTGAGVLYATTV